MHNVKENSIELDRIDRMSKINFQNMTIFTSYHMYLDALNTNINLKIENVTYCGHFGSKTGHFSPNPAFMASEQFSGQNGHNMLHLQFFEFIFVFSASKYI